MTPGAPTVYFIDDSATMREVIKIAFRRENINVVACHDGASALVQMEHQKPDVVISDVIMPEKDGYQVCEHIKHHPQLSKIPVILMSGVVNRAVAERAFAVKADELIRKPFQPQDLLGRVQHLLSPRAPAAPPAAAISANAALSTIFAMSANSLAALPRTAIPANSSAVLASPMSPAPAKPPTSAPDPVSPASLPSTLPVPGLYADGVDQDTPSPSPGPVPALAAEPRQPSPDPIPKPAPLPASTPRTAVSNLDLQKMKVEVLRLQGLVRKLQAELEAEREYCRALEAHVKTLQEAE
jgi:CheY-like chemotaxis protein